MNAPTKLPPIIQAIDRVWATVPDKPLRAWGSALGPTIEGSIKIITPELIGPTMRMTRPELRGPACPSCGGQQYFCECFPEGNY